MVPRLGIIWDSPIMFTRLAEDCGYAAELVTPHLLAAPFFRRSYAAVIVPGGFANPAYCTVLPALRACQTRIRRFVTDGGVVLTFGAGGDRPDAYDWVDSDLRYRFGFFEGTPDTGADPAAACITASCSDTISFDGVFDLPDPDRSAWMGAPEGDPAKGPVISIKVGGNPVLIDYPMGKGRFILTTIHEYPSREFLSGFCSSSGETLL